MNGIFEIDICNVVFVDEGLGACVRIGKSIVAMEQRIDAMRAIQYLCYAYILCKWI